MNQEEPVHKQKHEQKVLLHIHHNSEGSELEKFNPENEAFPKEDKETDLALTSYQNFMKTINKNIELPTLQLIKIKPISYEYVSPLLSNLPILSLPLSNLQSLSQSILEPFNIAPKEMLSSIITIIFKNYNNVSYHNISHGFSLMHMLKIVLGEWNKGGFDFSEEEIGWTLIAGLGHDLNHPGNNNAFEVGIGSALAREGEGVSVLEKMHIRTLFKIFEEAGLTTFSKSQERQHLKEMMVRQIISTDISSHFTNLAKLRTLTESEKIKSEKYFWLEQVFHACDIGNLCLDFDEYMNWSSLLSYEFENQVKLEVENEIKVSEFMKFKSMKGFYQGQIGFGTLGWENCRPFLEAAEKNIEMLTKKIEEAD